MRQLWLGPLLATVLTACAPEPDFTVVPHVETATVVDGVPGDPYTLYDDDGNELMTLIADDLGQAHFAYVPSEPMTLETNEGLQLPFLDADVLEPGTYEIRNEVTGERSRDFDVLDLHDPGPGTPYDQQVLSGVSWSPIDGPIGEVSEGFQYLEMRDGTLLSAMVRFPDPQFYGAGPYPTVVEYSGYAPSRPDRPDNATRIANALGYATVAVNMRGSGCSGGVFDVFNKAQSADGYDIIEIVAAQEWVKGGRVGMIGLSYPGISQLYVAAANPPHLAGVVPLSVIADAWEMQWPGGIYNAGFTRQWVEQREAEAAAGGAGWVTDLIEAGDTTCEANVALSRQNIDFEPFLRAMVSRPPSAADRDLRDLVGDIEAPVFLGGQFQDEQTGALFADMLDRFDSTAHLRVVLANGRHPDGYAPDIVFQWAEFLDFHVAERIPEVHPAIRIAGAGELGATFGMEGYRFPADRFTDFEDDFEGAKAAYLAEDPVTVLWENGAGDEAGWPVPTAVTTHAAWPLPEAETLTLHVVDGDALAPDPAALDGAYAWTFDPDAGSVITLSNGYDLLGPIWQTDWTRFADGDAVAVQTAPLEQDLTLAGNAVASLSLRSPDGQAPDVQVTLSEVAPDGTEWLLQTGWLRTTHRAGEVLEDLRIDRPYDAASEQDVPDGDWFTADVAIPAVGHVLRAGSRLRMTVSTPGRDHALWEFEPAGIEGTPTFEVGFGPGHDSTLSLSVIDGVDVPVERPACPSLRGQVCRPAVDYVNTVVE